MGLLNMGGCMHGVIVMFLFQFSAYEAGHMNDEVVCGFSCMYMDQCTHYVYDNNGYCDMADGRHVYNSTHQPHGMHVNEGRNETVASCNEFLISPAVASSITVVGLDGESVSTSTEYCRYVIAAKHEQSIKLELTYSCGNIRCNNDVIDVTLNNDSRHHMEPCFSTDFGSVKKNIGQKVTLNSMNSFIIEFTRSTNSSATLYGNIISDAPHATFCTNQTVNVPMTSPPQATTTTVATTVTRAPAATESSTSSCCTNGTVDVTRMSSPPTTATSFAIIQTSPSSTTIQTSTTATKIETTKTTVTSHLASATTTAATSTITRTKPTTQFTTTGRRIFSATSRIGTAAQMPTNATSPPSLTQTTTATTTTPKPTTTTRFIFTIPANTGTTIITPNITTPSLPPTHTRTDRQAVFADTTTFLSTNDALSVSNGTTTDTTAGMGSTETISTGGSGAETGVIVGAVLGSISGLLVVTGTAFLAYWIIKRRPHGQIAPKDIEMDDPVGGISVKASQKGESNLPATSP